MSQEEFSSRIASYLDIAGIPFMVAGSYASSFHGQPRTTHDVDFVIDPTKEQLDRFLDLLGNRCYVSRDAAHDALKRRFMFNVIDFDEGWKADLIVRKDRPFSVEEFRRRQPGTILGRSLPVASPEDVILSKLEWNKITPSERQVKDAWNIILIQRATLDRGYLRLWAAELGVLEELEPLLRKADETIPGS